MLCQLDEIKKYKNQAVINRFKKEYPEKSDRAEEIFTDLILFFWGTKKHKIDQEKKPNEESLNFFFIMDEDMREIDQMWHLFLLYTRDYADFCNKFFGEFLHHQPDLVPLFEKQGFEFKSNLEKFLNYSFDLYGDTVIRRWFAATLS